MKTLKDFVEVYEPKAPDEKKFKDKHVTIKFKDRNEVGGKENGDDVFNATNVKTVARKDNRHGYNVGEDEKVYEEADIESMDESELLEFALNLIEKTLTPAELKKREEIAKAIGRENPNMPMPQKMAIATAQAKKVAESSDEYGKSIDAEKRKNIGSGDLDKISKISAMLRAEKKPVKEEADILDETAKIVAHLQKRYGDNIRKSHVRSAANDFGVDASKLAKAVRTKLGVVRLEEENDDGWYTHNEMHGKVSKEHWKKGWRYNNLKDKPFYHQPTKTWHASIKEEAEELDELSSETKDAYAKKAVPQLNKLFQKSGKDADAARKYYNRKNTVRKIASEEIEQVDELSSKKLTDYMDKASDARGHRNLSTKKVDNRYAGVKKASDRLGEEEVIDEAINWTAYQAITKGHDGKPYNDIFDAHGSSIHKKIKDVRKERDNQPGTTHHATFLHDRMLKAYAHWYRDKKAVKEESEQIDEISKPTLGRYINKAKDSIDITSYRSGIKDGTAISSSTPYKPNNPLEKKLSKRHKGIETAVKKLTKEDAEQIDELSKDTMGRYINKAATKMGSQGVTAGLKIAADEKSSKNFKDMGKREKGIKLAVDKLTKEDIINRAVSKYVPEELKFTPEERMIKRLEGLREDHIDVLMGLFESLNDVNQAKMIESAETQEGRNQLLDFAINNRGA